MFSGAFGPSDLDRLMFGLLYPAVLGTVFFSLLPALVSILPYSRCRHREKMVTAKFVAGGLVVIHFIVDYQLAGSLPPGEYGCVPFLLDFLVLLALFVAFDALNIGNASEAQIRASALAMAVTYSLFLVWSLFALEMPLDLRPLWVTEAMGLVLFSLLAWRPRPTLFYLALATMAVVMAYLGSVTVGNIRDLGGSAAFDVSAPPIAKSRLSEPSPER